jgi:hypothetical protein
MKLSLCLGFIFLLSTSLHAETYSWIDDNGTYNYTENYSNVPKKFRKNVKRREEVPQNLNSRSQPLPKSEPNPSEKSTAPVTAVQAGDKELYGGKSAAAWRAGMNTLETELGRMETYAEQLRKQIFDAKGVSKAQFETLKKEYDDTRSSYDKEYKKYLGLIETIRKAGITVDIKKEGVTSLIDSK